MGRPNSTLRPLPPGKTQSALLPPLLAHAPRPVQPQRSRPLRHPAHLPCCLGPEFQGRGAHQTGRCGAGRERTGRLDAVGGRPTNSPPVAPPPRLSVAGVPRPGPPPEGRAAPRSPPTPPLNPDALIWGHPPTHPPKPCHCVSKRLTGRFQARLSLSEPSQQPVFQR